jgi:hypothetical protein
MLRSTVASSSTYGRQRTDSKVAWCSGPSASLPSIGEAMNG